MGLLDGVKARMQARKDAKKAIDEKLKTGFKEKIELEKGDLFAIIFAGFFNFVLPIMAVLTFICLVAYFFFTRFQ